MPIIQAETPQDVQLPSDVTYTRVVSVDGLTETYTLPKQSLNGMTGRVTLVKGKGTAHTKPT